MKLKIQSIKLENRREKDVLALMRKAISDSPYEYHIDQNGFMVRFTADQEGPILPLLHYEALQKESSEQLAEGDFALVYVVSESACQVIQVRNWVFRSSQIFLRESLSEQTLKKTRILFVDSELKANFPNLDPHDLPSLDENILENTDHFFGVKNTGLKAINKKYVALASVMVLATAGLLWTGGDEVDSSKAKPVEVPQTKFVRVDNFHEYKKELVGAVNYSQLAQPLMAATLMANKLPKGWEIDTITATQVGVEAHFVNHGGRTKDLKYFQENSGYQEFFDVEGQLARFFVPVVEPQWFDWTKKIASFTTVRDDVMDMFITLGAKINSNAEEKHKYYTKQEMGMHLEEVPIAYLDIVQTFLNENPIFIESITVKPFTQAPRRVSVDFKVSIIGR